MSEKQLTVAELMERAAKEGRAEAPRRRRRSLEEGGVSVAELTGSIPVVKAVPSDSRHSAEPIDAPFPTKAATSPPDTDTSDDSKPVEAAAKTANRMPPVEEPQSDSLVDSPEVEDTPPWIAAASIAGASGAAATLDDDTPPWLASNTDTPSSAADDEPSKFEEPSPWIPADASTEAENEQDFDDVPPWIAADTTSEAPEPVTDFEDAPPWVTAGSALEDEEEETPPWVVSAMESKQAAQPEQSPEAEETPPWIITDDDEDEDEETPPWLASAEERQQSQAAFPEPDFDDTPPWLQSGSSAEPASPITEDAEGPETAADAPAAPSPSTDKTMVISVVNENDPVRLTTGAFEAITPDQAAAAASSPHDETTQLPVVDDRAGADTAGVQSQFQSPSTPSSDTAALLEDDVQRPDIAEVIPMGGAAGSVATPSKKRDRKGKGKPQASGASNIPGPAPAVETQVQPAIDTPIPDPNAQQSAKPLPVKVEPRQQKEGKVSLLAIAGMTILAIVVGAALFMGFEMLWSNLPKWAVSLLALGVTGGIVGLVHALRTERDFLSMGFAGIAGLVMTFGPLAIVGL